MKKGLLIVSTLVFCVFGCINICAMGDDSAGDDPSTAADYAGDPQVPAAVPATYVPAPAAGPMAVVGTPVRGKNQAGQGQPQSATKATVVISNYCREIIQAFNEDRINDVLVLLDSFYNKIPSTLKDSTRKRTGDQKDADFEKKLRKDALNYHKSLFLCLAMCLKMSVSEEQPATSEDLTEKIDCGDDLSEISFKLSTATSNVYLIRFRIREIRDDGSGAASSSSSTSKQTSEWFVDVKPEISLLEPAAAGAGVIDISGRYKTGNFFKNTTTALVPASGDARPLLGPAPVFGRPNLTGIRSVDAAAGSAAPKVDEVLQNNLTLIFNAIPHKRRVYLEQYYHFLIFSLVNFMGSCLCFAEFITGDGRADLIIRTERDEKLHGSIIELKRAHTAKKALSQITSRKYINSFDDEFQIVGISISGRDKEPVTVSCEKQKITPSPAVISSEGGTYSMQITSHIPKPKAKSKKKTVMATADESKKKRKTEEKGEGTPETKKTKPSDGSGSEESGSDDE